MGGRCVRWIKWSGPFVPEKMPFLPLGEKVAFKTVEVVFQGERRVIKFEGAGERIVFGPWRIQLEAIGPKGEKKTIEQWAVRHRWTTEEGHVRVDTPAVLTRILGGRRVVTAKGASEERLAQELWGSEVLVGGASEYRWTGASESLLAGSSETLQFGGSETLLAGGSEWIFQAASESLFQGASQAAQRGASEHRWGGASELYGPDLPGASENRP
jgi:hypothetical protein